MEPLCALLQPGFHVSAVQREVVWCITNIASSALTEAETQLLLAAAPLLIMHLENAADVEIQALSAWALGNLAADSDHCRTTLRTGGAVAPLIVALSSSWPRVIHTAAWALSNLARGGAQSPTELMQVRSTWQTLAMIS